MENEKDIVFSQAVKAGKRIYYLDVKRNRRDELFLSITESKKILAGEGPDAPFTFEKHKIFLYQEDFSKFIGGLSKAISYIHENQPSGEAYPSPDESIIIEEGTEETTSLDGELDIQIDFE
ncbi:MAG: PUR family DNA/RNA-binding protein [Bacteroidaceae bacterium]|nr:PUR family DNA/RNA-binding protein [Bacteroidaceae bacterium]